MHECSECKHYISDLEVNYHDCWKDMDDKYWDMEEECPEFESKYPEEYEDA